MNCLLLREVKLVSWEQKTIIADVYETFTMRQSLFEYFLRAYFVPSIFPHAENAETKHNKTLLSWNFHSHMEAIFQTSEIRSILNGDECYEG